MGHVGRRGLGFSPLAVGVLWFVGVLAWRVLVLLVLFFLSFFLALVSVAR